jgi:hypothetical protein
MKCSFAFDACTRFFFVSDKKNKRKAFREKHSGKALRESIQGKHSGKSFRKSIQGKIFRD